MDGAFSSILAMGITDPDGSITVPLIAARSCASEEPVHSKITTNSCLTDKVVFFIVWVTLINGIESLFQNNDRYMTIKLLSNAIFSLRLGRRLSRIVTKEKLKSCKLKRYRGNQ